MGADQADGRAVKYTLRHYHRSGFWALRVVDEHGEVLAVHTSKDRSYLDGIRTRRFPNATEVTQ